MNVLILTTIFGPNIGGVETHLEDLIKYGIKKKIFFDILTYQPLVTEATGKYWEKGDGYQIFRVPWLRFNLFLTLEKYPFLEFIYLFPGLFIYGFFLLVLKSEKINIIHPQGLVAGTVGVILGILFGKKVIISTHSIYDFPPKSHYQSFVKFVLSNADHILTLSNQSRNEIVSIGVDPKKVSLFTNWVDQKRFYQGDKVEFKRKLLLPEKKFMCLFVGRLVEVKGVNELLQAARLMKDNQEVVIVIIGDGPLASKVKSESLKLKNLIFKGKVENQKLFEYYNASDVLIVPSTHEEGFGRVILESLSCGTPVIGSNRGAIPEAINKDVGILIDVTPKNIKETLESLVKNPIKLKKFSKSARPFAIKRYSSKNISMITKYYE